MPRPAWDQYFMGLAHYVSIRSHDEQTKVGCIVVNEKNHVVSMGYNGFPQGVEDTTLPAERPFKYPYMVHAEENAISNLISLSSLSLKTYLTHYPCYRCAKLLWQNNIKKWFIEKGGLAVSSTDDDKKVYKLLLDNGLEIVEISTKSSLLIESLK